VGFDASPRSQERPYSFTVGPISHEYSRPMASCSGRYRPRSIQREWDWCAPRWLKTSPGSISAILGRPTCPLSNAVKEVPGDDLPLNLPRPWLIVCCKATVWRFPRRNSRSSARVLLFINPCLGWCSAATHANRGLDARPVEGRFGAQPPSVEEVIHSAPEIICSRISVKGHAAPKSTRLLTHRHALDWMAFRAISRDEFRGVRQTVLRRR